MVALTGDVESFNPIVTSSTISSEVATALYPQMFNITFDLIAGKLIYEPALVKRWEFLNEGRDVKLIIRNDVRWENGVLVSPQDIKFTYELVGDPDVASPRSNYVDDMIFTNDKFDVDKSIEILDDTTMVFHFVHTYPQQLFHLTVPPIPKHIYGDADRRSLRSHPRNQKPLSAGPYSMEKWKRGEEITLVTNQKCTMPAPAVLEHVLFRVISGSDHPSHRAQEGQGGRDVAPVLRRRQGDPRRNIRTSSSRRFRHRLRLHRLGEHRFSGIPKERRQDDTAARACSATRGCARR
ncbi:MAG: hypothetical protein IPP94_11505 [Ignavibacteria bacterium]|nr:hypothetical protein [Ignavibacteria bacterium]